MAASIETRAVRWLLSGDTGVSSKTMLAAALGMPIKEPDVPHDPADFGRCVRLLEVIPELRAMFRRIGRRVPDFRPLLRSWGLLEAIYRRDLPTGRSDALYATLRELRGIPGYRFVKGGTKRLTAYPVDVEPGTVPVAVTQAQARRIIDRFNETGEHHTQTGATLWVLKEHARLTQTPVVVSFVKAYGWHVSKETA